MMMTREERLLEEKYNSHVRGVEAKLFHCMIMTGYPGLGCQFTFFFFFVFKMKNLVLSLLLLLSLDKLLVFRYF